jgi:Holliday junction resolvase-like predicted endonuclease
MEKRETVMQVQKIEPSPKRTGAYETLLIDQLSKHFKQIGFAVIAHAKLNFSYGCMFSELDMLLEKNGLLTYVEVKSDKDKISKAFEQVNRAKDYIDYAYIATNKRLKQWDDKNIGLISIQGDGIKITKRAKRFTHDPRFSTIFSLRKKCLIQFANKGHQCRDTQNKDFLARYIYSSKDKKLSRECLKEIVACSNMDCAACPITEFYAQ